MIYRKSCFGIRESFIGGLILKVRETVWYAQIALIKGHVVEKLPSYGDFLTDITLKMLYFAIEKT